MILRLLINFSFCIIIILINAHIILSDILIFSPKNETIDAFNDIPAEFGSPIPIMGISGYVVHAYPPKACAPIYPPPINLSLRTPWFVLIERNGCDFDYKVLNAQRAGYSLAIVYNFESDSLIPMHGYRFVKEINIPSVFVGWSAGIRIIKSYTYQSGNYLKITEDLPFDLNNYLLPFAIVIGICFLIMLVFIICKFVRERRYRMRNRLTARNLKSIPVKKYQVGDTTDVCAVCLEDYNEGDKLRILPCSHAYHSQCIDPWLTKNKRSCPVCKRKIVFGKKRTRTHGRRSKGRPGTEGANDEARDSDSNNLLRFLFPSSRQGSASLVTIIDVRSENDDDAVHSHDDDDDILYSSAAEDDGRTRASSSSAPRRYLGRRLDSRVSASYVPSSSDDDDDEGASPDGAYNDYYDHHVISGLERRSLIAPRSSSSYGAIPSAAAVPDARVSFNLSRRINDFLFGRRREEAHGGDEHEDEEVIVNVTDEPSPEPQLSFAENGTPWREAVIREIESPAASKR